MSVHHIDDIGHIGWIYLYVWPSLLGWVPEEEVSCKTPEQGMTAESRFRFEGPPPPQMGTEFRQFKPRRQPTRHHQMPRNSYVSVFTQLKFAIHSRLPRYLRSKWIYGARDYTQHRAATTSGHGSEIPEQTATRILSLGLFVTTCSFQDRLLFTYPPSLPNQGVKQHARL